MECLISQASITRPNGAGGTSHDPRKTTSDFEPERFTCHRNTWRRGVKESDGVEFKAGFNTGLTDECVRALVAALKTAITQMRFVDALDLNDTNRPTIELFCEPALTNYDSAVKALGIKESG